MESTLFKMITPNQITKLFDAYEKINIRFSQPVKKETITDYDEKIKYKIVIRHCEDEKAEDILNSAIKELKK